MQSTDEHFMASKNFFRRILSRIFGSAKRDVGAKGEELAAKHLSRNGYRILDRNWRCRAGELDIVASRGNLCIFVEVKSSERVIHFRPEDRVHSRKQAKLRSLAGQYLKRQRLDVSCRFDVIAVWWENGQPQLRHIENAF